MTTVIRYHDGTWRDAAGQRSLFYRMWEVEHPQALVVIVHGFGEHSGRYDHVARVLASCGLTVACPDLRGHGQSPGLRGDIERFEQYLDDLTAITDHVFSPRVPSKGVVVFGHSFGGLVALHWAARRPQDIRCLVIQSPLLGVGFHVPRWKEYAAAVLARWFPRLTLPGGVNPAWLSHDPTVVDGYRHDPLVHDQVSLRGYGMIRRAMSQARAFAGQITVPVLLLYGSEDHVVSVQACREVAGLLVCENRVKEFPGAYHELHHESIEPELLAEIAQWIHAHV